MSKNLLLACHECDALQQAPLVARGCKVHCVNCGSLLYHHPRGGVDRPLALFIGAWMFYLLANSFPLVTLDISGASRTTTLLGTAWALYQHDMKLLGGLVFFTSTAAPGLILSSILYVLSALKFQLALPGVRQVLVFISRIHPWEMADVFVLSVLVALVKLSGSAEVIMNMGIFALMSMIVLVVAGSGNLDILLLWEKLSDLFERTESMAVQAVKS